MSLPESLERAASALAQDADGIRPANGDPVQLLGLLEPEAAVRVLGWLLAHEPESGAELAVAWVEEEGGAEPLQAVDERTLPKAGRKALRRALHCLRSRGVELAGAASAEPVVARLPELEDRFEAGFVSAVDPSGSMLVYVVETGDSGGARMFEVLLSESRGLLDFQVYNTGRSRVRKFISQVKADSRSSAIDADVDAVRALISEVAARHPADRTLPRQFSTWRSRLVPTDAAAPTPGAQALEALSAEPEPAQLRGAAELVRSGELGPWPESSQRLGEVLERIRERVRGRIVLSEAGQRERVDAALSEAAAELFDAEYGEATAKRFAQSAYVFWKLGKEEEARLSVSAALAFRDLAPTDNPVAMALLDVALGSALKSLREEDPDAEETKDASSPLVEP